MLSEPVPTLPFCPGCPRFSIFGPPSAPSSISVVLLDLGQTAQSCRQGRGRGQDPLPWLLPLGRQGRGAVRDLFLVRRDRRERLGPPRPRWSSLSLVVLLRDQKPKIEDTWCKTEALGPDRRSNSEHAKSIDDPQRRSFARQQPQQRAGRGGERTIIRRGAAGRKIREILLRPQRPPVQRS